ncbi:unnamed protein product [Adineta steineri]|uniref:Uncharacterized protein n=1 Tax=Adineta steineri TaxID=433720 RepID=A0A819F1G8_9BILA|nr:unnamed protein product [Adineta steineri]CAF3857406.1 unnamed protein product [Adineta steineri]
MAEKQRVILVTGANRGIGFLIIKKLVENSSSNNDIILLGSRDLKRGQDAFIQLNSPSNVHVLQLDTSYQDSISCAIDEIKNKYGGQIDIVINNAAILTQEITVGTARALFNTNYYGVKILNEHLISMIRENGRIINVSSRVGVNILQDITPALRQKYISSTLTKEQLDQLVEDFISAIETNTLENIGYNTKSEVLVYGVTKMALNALTQIEAREWSTTKNLVIVSVTPGFCSTDMTQHASEARPAELGAYSILYVVNAHQNELINGAFYRDGKQIPLTDESTIKNQ